MFGSEKPMWGTTPPKRRLTCTFKAQGRFEAVASATLKVIQSDSLAQPFPTDSSSLLAGAIQAEAAYSFAFEPVRALEGMTRRFEIGSVTVDIDGAKKAVVTDFPATFSEPIEVVKPLISPRPAITALGFAHEGDDELLAERTRTSTGKIFDVVFQENFPENHFLKIFRRPSLWFGASHAMNLPETARKISPKRLSDLIDTRIWVRKPEIVKSEKTDFSFFYGPKDGAITHQGALTLSQPTVWLNFKTVEGSDYSEELEK